MLLKPDGVVQWTEPNLSQARDILRGGAAPDAPEYLKVVADGAWPAASPLMWTVVDQAGWKALRDALPASGYRKFIMDRVSTDRFVGGREAFSKNIVTVLDNQRAGFVRMHGSNEQDLKDGLKALADAIAAGCYIRVNLHTYIAWN